MTITFSRCLLAIVVVGSAGMAFGWPGSVAAIVGFGALLYVAAARAKLQAAFLLISIVSIAVMLIAVALPPLVCDSSSSCRRQCSNNLRCIGRALQQYHDVYGCFPPACVRDKDGKPMHSWRVLLLPYLEQGDLLTRYNMKEPWDSPANSKLAGQMPSMYACPGDVDAERSGKTSYVAVVGPETAWPPAGAMKQSGIHDKPGETILLVEVAGLDIPWTEPRDMAFDEAVAGFNRASGMLRLASRHRFMTNPIYREAGACLVFCDGQGGFLSEDTPSEAIASLLTANGGETIPPGVLDARRLDGRKCLALASLVVAMALLAASYISDFWPRRTMELPDDLRVSEEGVSSGKDLVP
jgi:hypothetical protein